MVRHHVSGVVYAPGVQTSFQFSMAQAFAPRSKLIEVVQESESFVRLVQWAQLKPQIEKAPELRLFRSMPLVPPYLIARPGWSQSKRFGHPLVAVLLYSLVRTDCRPILASKFAAPSLRLLLALAVP